jgi:hypothetical protein
LSSIVSLDHFKGRANSNPAALKLRCLKKPKSIRSFSKDDREIGDTFGDKNSPFCYTWASFGSLFCVVCDEIRVAMALKIATDETGDSAFTPD